MPARKQEVYQQFQEYLLKYNNLLVFSTDNIASRIFIKIRRDTRGDDTKFLFGKNTYLRKALNEICEKHDFNYMKQFLNGAVGFCFTNEDPRVIAKMLSDAKCEASARPGIFAPDDVWLKKQSTGLIPITSSFFQTVGIPTKIVKGQVDIIEDVHLIKKGVRVNQSQSALLALLKVTPFTYECNIKAIVFNGKLLAAEVAFLEPASIEAALSSCVADLAAISLASGTVNKLSAATSLKKAYVDSLCVGLATGFVDSSALDSLCVCGDGDSSAAPAAAAATSAAAVEEEAADEELGEEDFEL